MSLTKKKLVSYSSLKLPAGLSVAK